LKSILGLGGVSPRGRYVRPTHFISENPTQCKTSFRLKNPREIFLLKTFVGITMNELLAKLTEQCYEYNETMQGTWFNKTKFAQLIVEECAGVAFAKAPSDESACDISQAIEEHFGVEE